MARFEQARNEARTRPAKCASDRRKRKRERDRLRRLSDARAVFMSVSDQLRSRIVSLLGLNLDFNIDLSRRRFSEIDETLFVGRRPRADDVDELRRLGITDVISCLPEPERASMSFLQAHLRCLFVPLHDGMHEDISPSLPLAFEFARRASKDLDATRLLIHCEVGVSRSATFAIALLMKRDRARFIDTFQRVHERRPEVLPNIGFASQLQHLEHSELGPRRGEPSSLARYLHDVCNVPVDIQTLEGSLAQHDYDGPAAIRAIFGEIPRVVQGARR